MAFLAENRYGKSRVRLARVARHGGAHTFREWTVDIAHEGEYRDCFVHGDNSMILPTDTMKNTVYSLARTSSALCMEDFAGELIDFFLDRNPQTSRVTVEIEEKRWDHLIVSGQPCPTAFRQGGSELQTTVVSRSRGTAAAVTSGVKDLLVLKTAKSAFTGFIKDPLTTLRETDDRLFATKIAAAWAYDGSGLSFDDLRKTINDALLATFAEHDSLSVQQTLFAMGEAALEAAPRIREISLTLPNKHYLLADLSPFGQDNPNLVFIPTDEPHGTIQATISREER